MPDAPDAPSSQAVPTGLIEMTTSDRRVLAGSSLLVAGRIVSKLAVVIFLVVAARLLSKTEYGIYSYVLVLAHTFAILADPQVSVIAGRDVSAGRRSAAVAYRSALPVVAAAGMLSAVALVVFGTIDPGPGTTVTLLVLAGLYVIGNRLLSLGLDLLRALGRFNVEVAIEAGGTIVLVVTATLVAVRGGGVAGVLAVFAVHSIVSALICRALLRRDIAAPISAPGYRGSLVRSGLVLSGAAAATAVATRCSLIVLGLAASATAVAELSAGLRFVDAFYVLALTAGQALLPSLTAILTDQPGRAIRLIRRAVVLMVLAGAALAAVVAPLSDELMRAIFGADYAASGALLAILAVSLPFTGMFWISWFGLCAYDRERVVFAVTLGCAVVAVVLAATVVPTEGATGAAWVYCATVAALGLATYAALERCARADRAVIGVPT